jgi:hypothetical protein
MLPLWLLPPIRQAYCVAPELIRAYRPHGWLRKSMIPAQDRDDGEGRHAPAQRPAPTASRPPRRRPGNPKPSAKAAQNATRKKPLAQASGQRVIRDALQERGLRAGLPSAPAASREAAFQTDWGNSLNRGRRCISGIIQSALLRSAPCLGETELSQAHMASCD